MGESLSTLLTLSDASTGALRTRVSSIVSQLTKPILWCYVFSWIVNNNRRSVLPFQGFFVWISQLRWFLPTAILLVWLRLWGWSIKTAGSLFCAFWDHASIYVDTLPSMMRTGPRLWGLVLRQVSLSQRFYDPFGFSPLYCWKVIFHIAYDVFITRMQLIKGLLGWFFILLIWGVWRLINLRLKCHSFSMGTVTRGKFSWIT